MTASLRKQFSDLGWSVTEDIPASGEEATVTLQHPDLTVAPVVSGSDDGMLIRNINDFACHYDPEAEALAESENGHVGYFAALVQEDANAAGLKKLATCLMDWYAGQVLGTMQDIAV